MKKTNYSGLNATLIHQLKEKIEDIGKSERKYRTLLENLPQRIFLKDRDSVYISCNENYAKDLKIKPYEIAGKTDYDFYPKQLAKKYGDDDKRTTDSGNTEDLEEEYVKDGQKFFVHTIKVPVRDNKGKVIGVLGIFWDITKSKQMENQLKESEEKFRNIFNKSADGMAIADAETKRFVEVNNSYCRLTGYSKDELLKKTIIDIHPKKDLAYVLNEFKLQAEGKKNLGENIPILRKDGNVVYTDVNSVPIFINNSPSLLGIFRDITARKQMEEKLKESEQKFRAVFEESIDGMAISDARTRKFVDVNKAYETLVGRPKKELIGKNISLVLSKEAVEQAVKIFNKMSKSKKQKTSVRNTPFLRKNGSLVYVDISLVVVPVNGVPYLIGIFRKAENK